MFLRAVGFPSVPSLPICPYFLFPYFASRIDFGAFPCCIWPFLRTVVFWYFPFYYFYAIDGFLLFAFHWCGLVVANNVFTASSHSRFIIIL